MARTQIGTSLIGVFNNTFVGVGRNRVINGEMLIDQRNGGNAATVSGGGFAYGPDMLIGSSSGGTAGVFTITRSSATPPTGFTHIARITCTTADASIAATDEYDLRSDIEGRGVRDFLFGTADAKAVTLSFWVRSSLTGTYTGSLQNGAQTRSYPFEYTISVADTWEYKTITAAGDTTGTWLTDTGVGFRIRWAFALGSNFTGTANTWAGSNLVGTSNQVNFMSSSTSRTWDVTGVQIELGSAATAFEYRPFQQEISLCSRYYEKSYAVDVNPATVTTFGRHLHSGSSDGSSDLFTTLYFKVQKRVAPTMTYYTQAGTSGSWQFGRNGASGNATITTVDSMVNSVGIQVPLGATWIVGFTVGQWIADASL